MPQPELSWQFRHPQGIHSANSLPGYSNCQHKCNFLSMCRWFVSVHRKEALCANTSKITRGQQQVIKWQLCCHLVKVVDPQHCSHHSGPFTTSYNPQCCGEQKKNIILTPSHWVEVDFFPLDLQPAANQHLNSIRIMPVLYEVYYSLHSVLLKGQCWLSIRDLSSNTFISDFWHHLDYDGSFPAHFLRRNAVFDA